MTYPPVEAPPERMMTAREVATYLHLHLNTVRRYADEGLIPYVRVNSRGDRRFRPSDVERFIGEQIARYAAQTPR